MRRSCTRFKNPQAGQARARSSRSSLHNADIGNVVAIEVSGHNSARTAHCEDDRQLKGTFAVAEEQTGAQRCWRAIEVLTTEHALEEPAWSDVFSCEPIDVNEPPGFVDTTTIVEGTWSMAPL